MLASGCQPQPQPTDQNAAAQQPTKPKNNAHHNTPNAANRRNQIITPTPAAAHRPHGNAKPQPQTEQTQQHNSNARRNKKGLRDRNSRTCTLNQNGYGTCTRLNRQPAAPPYKCASRQMDSTPATYGPQPITLQQTHKTPAPHQMKRTRQHGHQAIGA